MSSPPRLVRPVQPFLVAGASLGAGLLASAGFEPLAVGWLVPLGTACWLAVTAGAGRTVAAASGLLFGLGFFLPLLAWLGPSIGVGAWVGLGIVQALWFGLAGTAVRAVRGVPGAALASAAVLTAVELARQSWPFGGLPWGRAGFSVVDTAWSGLLPWIGVTGTTFVLMLLAATAAEAVREAGVRTLSTVVVVAVCSVIPQMAPPVTASSKETFTVAAVQGGVPGDGRSVAAFHRTITRAHRDATVRLAQQVADGDVAKPDLVVWPESSTAVDPVNDPRARRAVDEASRAIGVPLLVNGIVSADDPDEALNQALLWNPGGGAGARYTKRHPVPFGEYVPFRDLLGGASDRFREIPRNILPGRETPPMEVVGDDVVEVAMAICFDVAYDDVIAPQVAAGAEVVVVQTSNATFTGTSQLDQQLALTRARALEVGRAVVVSSVNGVSAVIDPEGVVVAQSPTQVTDVLVQRVPLVADLTPVTRLAPVLGPAVWLLAGLSLGLAVVQRRRQAVPTVVRGSRCTR